MDIQSIALPHQLQCALYMTKHDRLILWHALGSGKTFTSLLAARYNSELRTVVITYSTMIESTFAGEYNKFKTMFPHTTPNITFMRWMTMLREDKREIINKLKRCFIIIDEAHGLRGSSQTAKASDFMGEVIKTLFRENYGSKVLMLTGTPIVDSIRDVYSLLEIMNVDLFELGLEEKIETSYKFISRFSTRTRPINFQGIFVDNALTKVVPIKLKKDTSNRYKKQTRGREDFYVRLVDICLEGGEKYEYMIREMERELGAEEQARVYIYCERTRTPGIPDICRIIKSKGWKFISITGKNSKSIDIGEIGDYRVIVGSKASSEGINIHGLTQVHILTPHWNISHLEQIIGRGTRYEAGENVENARPIDVFCYVAYSEKLISDPGYSIDYYKYSLCYEKNMEAMKFYNYSHRLLPVPVLIPSPSISPEDLYEKIMEGEKITGVSSLPKITLDKIINMSNLRKHNIQVIDDTLMLVDPYCDLEIKLSSSSLLYSSEIFRSPSSEEKEIVVASSAFESFPWKFLFDHIRRLSWLDALELLEISVIEKELTVMKIFENSLCFVGNDIYHTFLYREPSETSYNVAYVLTKSLGLTKKLVTAASGELIWRKCIPEEEKSVWKKLASRNFLQRGYVTMIYSIRDSKFRLRIGGGAIRIEDNYVSDKRLVNRGKDIWSFSLEELKRIYMYLINSQYIYCNKGYKFKSKKEIISNIKWIFYDQNDIVVL